MSMMVSFVLSFFPRDVLDEILNLIESVSEDFPSYSCHGKGKISEKIEIFSRSGNSVDGKGKFRKDFKSQGKDREFKNKWL